MEEKDNHIQLGKLNGLGLGQTLLGFYKALGFSRDSVMALKSKDKKTTFIHVL